MRQSYIAVGHLAEIQAARSIAPYVHSQSFPGQLFSPEQVDTSKSTKIPSQSICYMLLINTDQNLPEMIALSNESFCLNVLWDTMLI